METVAGEADIEATLGNLLVVSRKILNSCCDVTAVFCGLPLLIFIFLNSGKSANARDNTSPATR